MVFHCAVFGCDSRPMKFVHLYELPKNAEIRQKWLKFIKRTRVYNEKNYRKCHVCSKHFTDSEFENLLQVKMGFKKMLKLKSDAVPTLYPTLPSECVDFYSADVSEKVRKRANTDSQHFEGGLDTTSENPNPIKDVYPADSSSGRNDTKGRKQLSEAGKVVSKAIADLAAAAADQDTDSAAEDDVTQQLSGKTLVIKPETDVSNHDNDALDSNHTVSSAAPLNGRKRVGSWSTEQEEGEQVPEKRQKTQPRKRLRASIANATVAMDTAAHLPTPPASAAATPTRRSGRQRKTVQPQPSIETDVSTSEVDSVLNFSDRFCLCNPNTDPADKSGPHDYQELKTHLRECLEVLDQVHDRHCKKTLVKTKLEVCLDMLNMVQGELPFIPSGEVKIEANYDQDPDTSLGSEVVADGPGFRIKLEPTWDSDEQSNHSELPTDLDLKVTKVKSKRKSSKPPSKRVTSITQAQKNDSSFDDTIESLNTLSKLSQSLATPVATHTQVIAPSVPTGSVFPTPIVVTNSSAGIEGDQSVVLGNQPIVVGSAVSLQGANLQDEHKPP